MLACLLAGGLAACGGDDGTTASTVRGPETADPLPKLPRRWTVEVNRQGGFAIGVPPAWKAKSTAQQATLIHSPDRRVAVSISADRTDEALEAPLTDLAVEIADNLEGNGFGKVRVGRPRPLKHRYQAVSVTATARSNSGVHERLQIISLRRDRLAGFAVLVARRASIPSRLYRPATRRMIASLRGRPLDTAG
jgi:hypothetical protein